MATAASWLTASATHSPSVVLTLRHQFGLGRRLCPGSPVWSRFSQLAVLAMMLFVFSALSATQISLRKEEEKVNAALRAKWAQQRRLADQFYAMLKKKDPHRLESKMHNARYISELVKFKVCPPVQVFSMLKKCFEDFAFHNVEVVCCLVENCGPFLLNSEMRLICSFRSGI